MECGIPVFGNVLGPVFFAEIPYRLVLMLLKICHSSFMIHLSQEHLNAACGLQGQLCYVQINKKQKVETPRVRAPIRAVYSEIINPSCLHQRETDSSRPKDNELSTKEQTTVHCNLLYTTAGSCTQTEEYKYHQVISR